MQVWCGTCVRENQLKVYYTRHYTLLISYSQLSIEMLFFKHQQIQKCEPALDQCGQRFIATICIFVYFQHKPHSNHSGRRKSNETFLCAPEPMNARTKPLNAIICFPCTILCRVLIWFQCAYTSVTFTAICTLSDRHILPIQQNFEWNAFAWYRCCGGILLLLVSIPVLWWNFWIFLYRQHNANRFNLVIFPLPHPAEEGTLFPHSCRIAKLEKYTLPHYRVKPIKMWRTDK